MSGLGSAIGNRHMFNGREYDAESGLYWYRTRYMDPKLGRFIARDTIGLWGDENNLGNPYSYCGNNPWTRLDPYGEGPNDRFGSDPYEVEVSYTLASTMSGLAKHSWNKAVAAFDFVGWYFWASEAERQHEFNTAVVNTVLFVDAVDKDKTGAAGAAWDATKQYGSTALDTPNTAGNAISQGMLVTVEVGAPFAELGSLANLRMLGNIDDISIPKRGIDSIPESPWIASPPVAVQVFPEPAAFSKVAPATAKQLQKKFKHAVDFGVTGNYNPANAKTFNQAVQDHLNAPGTKEISGTYRGNPATFHTDPNSGLTVIQNPNGSFLSGWKLNPQQLQRVLKEGKL